MQVVGPDVCDPSQRQLEDRLFKFIGVPKNRELPIDLALCVAAALAFIGNAILFNLVNGKDYPTIIAGALAALSIPVVLFSWHRRTNR
jgi:hypothetical protein